MSTPTFAEFLALPATAIHDVVPATIVYAPAGTRRSAVLAGVANDAYAQWSRTQMIRACRLLFDHGVQHIFTISVTPGQFAEVGAYREKLLDWVEWGLTGPEALADYRELGWRVRMPCCDEIPRLADAAERLRQETASASGKTLWCMVIPDDEAPWRWILQALARSKATTRQQAIRALYGEDVPLTTLYLSFGKPIVAPDLLPPLLMDKVQCYWTQRPGYSLTAPELRSILYDYAYLRPTWQQDKTGRADAVLATRTAWEKGPVLGLGLRLGPFWYPMPNLAPSDLGDAARWAWPLAESESETEAE